MPIKSSSTVYVDKRPSIAMLPSNFGITNKDAAILLLKVRKIAMDEVHSSNVPEQGKMSTFAVTPEPSKTLFIDNCDSSFDHNVFGRKISQPIDLSPSTNHSIIGTNRFRTVSLCSASEFGEPQRKCSFDFIMMPRICIPQSEFKINKTIANKQETPCLFNLVDSSSDSSVSSASTTEESYNEIEQTEIFNVCSFKPDSPPTSPVSSNSSPKITVGDSSDHCDDQNNSKFVGTQVSFEDKVRDVLRKKFSWKSFPELERYLIENRVQYLQYSNQLNYTAEQKRYNNRLTQGLLDLAAEEGYLFEGFTFAAVRDRIRCYYKSYVQATKKKKQKVKRHPNK